LSLNWDSLAGIQSLSEATFASLSRLLRASADDNVLDSYGYVSIAELANASRGPDCEGYLARGRPACEPS
jgi:hypothetical protein